MKRFFVTLAVLAVALQPVGVSGQGFAPVPQPVEFLNFAGGSGVNGTFGVQVGPYAGFFASAPTQQFALYCVDYLHYASDANGLVNATQISASSDMSYTRLESFGAYRQAAYLSSLFEGWEVHESALESMFAVDFQKSNVWGGLHAAIWNIGTGPTDLGSGVVKTAMARDYFLGLAGQNAASFSTAGWYVLTDLDVGLQGNAAHDGTGQEFLVRASVPETSTIVLMATGLLLLIGAARRRESFGLAA